MAVRLLKGLVLPKKLNSKSLPLLVWGGWWVGEVVTPSLDIRIQCANVASSVSTVFGIYQ